MFFIFVMGFGVVCYFITLVFVCWLLYNWVFGLFYCFFENIEVINVFVLLGSKVVFSLFCFLVSILVIFLFLGLSMG